MMSNTRPNLKDINVFTMSSGFILELMIFVANVDPSLFF